MSFFPARASGIILHPTSLPGPYGIGDLGPSAHRFLRFLSRAGQSLWQVLPVGPTGFGDSPYACFSSFAGNPLLVSPDALAGWGLLEEKDLEGAPGQPEGRVDYGRVILWKLPVLKRAAERFLARQGGPRWERFRAFREAEAWWLEDYCLFMALKAEFQERAARRGEPGGAWNDSWDPDVALGDPAALERWRARLRPETSLEQAIQFFFFEQWGSLRAEAGRLGIRIIGDLPIFAAPDSADVWANRRLFLLDAQGRPTVVSGVPPDYFSRTGQLWGNPLYDWEACAAEDYSFWVSRIRAARTLFDFVRIDHFRGFEACWTIPAGEKTAEGGRWVKAPGEALFETLQKRLGDLPLIAEDLGVITPEVNALRERFGLPGMRVLQFAFDAGEAGRLSADNRFLPHNHAPDSVVYTGTHDNDTTRGWFSGRTPQEVDYLARYCGFPDPEIEWRFIRMAMASVCRLALFPMQDALGLGSEARLNTPGTTGGNNWSWRLGEGDLSDPLAERLRDLSALYGRLPSG